MCIPNASYGMHYTMPRNSKHTSAVEVCALINVKHVVVKVWVTYVIVFAMQGSGCRVIVKLILVRVHTFLFSNGSVPQINYFSC